MSNVHSATGRRESQPQSATFLPRLDHSGAATFLYNSLQPTDKPAMPIRRHEQTLRALRRRLNRRCYVHPDPLEFLYGYDDPEDREVAALVASSLAYGRVEQILKAVSAVLERLGPRPARMIRDQSPRRLAEKLEGFKYRFATGANVAAMLSGARRLIRARGSLAASFAAGLRPGDSTVLPAMRAFAAELSCGNGCGHLVPDVAAGSACKRLNLMLRWLVRRDQVDPGGWQAVPAAMLIVPLDTHMHRIGLALAATDRKTADMRTALELTAAFRRIAPADPTRYDFALTRLGIRREMSLQAFLERCASANQET